MTREEREKEYLLLLEADARRAREHPINFINSFLYTFDPKRPPHHHRFKLFPYQEDYVRELKDAIDNGHDLFVEKSREMGVTYVSLGVILWYWLFIEGSTFLLGSRKEDLVDNTKNNSAGSNKEESLFGKLEYMIAHIEPAARPLVLPPGFSAKDISFMSMVNPVNGNSIGGEATNANFSRGGRFKAILMDEFAFWDDDTAAWGSTADTTNCRVVVTTPGNRPSKAKRLRFGEDGEKIKVLTLDRTLDPRKDKKWEEKERERRSREDFSREIEINWDTAIGGKIYSAEMQRVTFGQFPYVPEWELYFCWDLGLDGVALQAWQYNPKNGKWRIVDCYENADKPIRFYFPLIGEPISAEFQYQSADEDAINSFSVFRKPVHFGDPDVSKRTLLTGTSVRQEFQSLNVFIQTKPEALDFISRRDRTKLLLGRGIEANDTPRVRHWARCMNEASMPQRSDNSQSTAANSKPIHNRTSHHRSSTEYLAVNVNLGQALKRPVEVNEDEEDRPRVVVTGRTINSRMNSLYRHRFKRRR